MKTLAILFAVPLLAQTAAFRDPSRPGMLKADILNGNLQVRGYSGKEVRVTGGPPNGVSISEGGENMLTVSGGTARAANLSIEVPLRTGLYLRCVNCGEVSVEGVEGDIDVNSVNGRVRLTHVSGSVLAHSENGAIAVVIDRVDANKPISLSSMNGAIDCTLPANLKANVNLRTSNGSIHSDFDIKIGGRGVPVRLDRGLTGTIQGGGPELVLKTVNGAISLRKQ